MADAGKGPQKKDRKMIMPARASWIASYILIGLAVCLTGIAGDKMKPNLIVIMTDDMGYADVGFNGCRDIPTPNIDRIAESGVRCTSGYVGYSVCGPSRAAFMTGRYGQRFGFEQIAWTSVVLVRPAGAGGDGAGVISSVAVTTMPSSTPVMKSRLREAEKKSAWE